MEELLKHQIQETSKRFDDLHADVRELSVKLENIREFKIKLLAGASTISIIVSVICGVVTLFATVFTIKHN